MNNKLILTMAMALCLNAGNVCAKNDKKTMTVKEALQKRHSVRHYSGKAVSEQQIIDILWAGNGISHDDKRTAPSAVNAQDIEMYVCKADGAYRYNAEKNSIEKVTGEDIRPLMQAQNKFIMTAPLTILLVTDQTQFGEPRPGNRNMNFGLMDAGLVSENISLYCTAIGLGTVPCAPRMKIEEIQKALKLTDQQVPVLYHPIGYEE